MKETDLMIGDWVRLNSEEGEIIPLNVQSIEFDSVWCNYTDDDTCDEFTYYDIVPIPLTEEILEANGVNWNKDFKVCTDLHHFSFTKDLHFCRVYNMDDDYHHEVMMPFNYVHELQHALRLCGMNELADNFKIKIKEE